MRRVLIQSIHNLNKLRCPLLSLPLSRLIRHFVTVSIATLKRPSLPSSFILNLAIPMDVNSSLNVHLSFPVLFRVWDEANMNKDGRARDSCDVRCCGHRKGIVAGKEKLTDLVGERRSVIAT